jgi:hypothetical protein
MILPIAAAVIAVLGLFLFFRSYFKLDKNFYLSLLILLMMVLGINLVMSDIRIGSGPDTNSIAFKSNTLYITDTDAEYYVFFTKGIIDFTSITAGAGNHLIDCYTVFGKTKILIREDVPTRILLYPTFGLIKLPNGMRYIPFFRNFYPNKAFKKEVPAIDIKINIIFGIVEIEEERPR